MLNRLLLKLQMSWELSMRMLLRDLKLRSFGKRKVRSEQLTMVVTGMCVIFVGHMSHVKYNVQCFPLYDILLALGNPR